MKKPAFLCFLWFFSVSGLCFGGPLLDPPTWNTWAHATVTTVNGAGDESEGTVDESERCSYDIELLVARSQQVLPGGLSELDLDKYNSQVNQLKTSYESSEDRGRLLMSRELHGIGGAGAKRETQQVWIKVESFIVHYIRVFDALDAGILTKVEDQTSGVYFGRVDTLPNPERMRRLVEEAMKDPQKMEEIREESTKISGQGTHEIVMNGVVIPLNADGSPVNLEVDLNSAEFWSQLPDDDSRKRLETAIYVLFMAMKDDNTFPMLQEKWITPSIDGVPVDTRLKGCGVSFTGIQMKTDALGFDAPPDDVLEDFFGKKVFPLPNPQVSFDKLHKSTL